MGDLYERDGTCPDCGEALFIGPMMCSACGCPPPSRWLPPNAPDESAPAPDGASFVDSLCQHGDCNEPATMLVGDEMVCREHGIGGWEDAVLIDSDDATLDLFAPSVGLTDAQVEHALREAGKLRAEPDPEAIEAVRRRLPLGGES